MDTMIGSKIFNYKITRLIGEGGMAKVYEAVHDKFENRHVAVKILDPILTANADIRQRFENEAKIMATLDHPNIVKVMDYTDAPDKLAIVMEYLEGYTLSEFVKKHGPMNHDLAAKLMTNMLQAFEYAHNHGVVHRDVKPSNIHLDAQMNPKIMDFGIAKLLTTDNNMTRTGTQMGTPTYMSPEQVRDVKDIDKRSDIYSLGVTFYFMLSGAAPYNTSTLSTFDIYNKIVHEPLPPITTNTGFNAVILKATAKNPGDRYGSCMDMVAAINQGNDDKPLKPANDDDEKTIIATEEIIKPRIKEPAAKSKPEPAEKPNKPAEKPKEPVLKTAEPKKSYKKLIMIASMVVIIAAGGYALMQTGLLSGGKPSLENGSDSVSYCLGVMEGKYLSEKFDTVNLEGLKKGVMEATRTSTADMPESQIMVKYLRNNSKAFTYKASTYYNEEECFGMFRAYGAYLFKITDADRIYNISNKLFFQGLKASVTNQDLVIDFEQAVRFSSSYAGNNGAMASAKNIAAEKMFFKDLAGRSAIRSTPGGVYYEVITEGFGRIPALKSTIRLKYAIRDMNGTLITSEDNRYLFMKDLMPGWVDVFKIMKEGSVYKVYVPSGLAYGANGLTPDNIEPYTTLVCDMELLGIN